MDLQALTNMNNSLTAHLNKMKEQQEAKKNSATCNNNTQKKDDIVLARKGDNGYVQCFDLDNNGEITLDEFNQYCEENGVSEKEKLKILSLMGNAKTSSKVIDKTAKNEQKDTDKEKIESSIYARKGDDKYNENMDTDRNDVVTYKEYMEYCNKRAKDLENNNSENDNSQQNRAVQAYSKTEHFNNEEELSVETEV